MKFTLGDLQPNPFRDLDRNPLSEEKLEILRESIQSTGFWGHNIVARLNSDDLPEIAYGHHRVSAAIEILGADYEFELAIEDLSDTAMLQKMARENNEVYGNTSAVADQEIVRAVVQAFGAGQIELGEVSARSKVTALRCAPSFVLGDDADARRHHGTDRAYNSNTVATFLGWHVSVTKRGGNDKAADTLSALEFIERGLVKESAFSGLGTSQARQVIVAIRKQIKEEEEQQRRKAPARQPRGVTGPGAPPAPRAITDGRSAPSVSTTSSVNVQAIADAAARAASQGGNPGAAAKRKQQELSPAPKPDINVVAEGVRTKIVKTLESWRKNALTKTLDDLISVRHAISPKLRDELATALETVAARYQQKADALREEVE